MTSNVPATGARARLQSIFPPQWRENWYKLSSAAVMFLLAFGVLDNSTAALWGQLVVATVTLIFALIYATSPWRVALYAIVAPAGAVLLYYGIVTDVRWALITAAVAQALGITTAAANVIKGPITVNPDGSLVT